MTLKVFITLFCAVILSACATIDKNWKENHCNVNGAYANGMNDGKNNYDMDPNYAKGCMGDDSEQLNISYRSGYENGLKAAPKKFEIQSTNVGDSDNNGSTKAAGWICLDTSFKKVCGYGCMKSSFDHVYCGSQPADNCVKDGFGNVKCGKNCYADNMGFLQCDRERTVRKD